MRRWQWMIVCILVVSFLLLAIRWCAWPAVKLYPLGSKGECISGLLSPGAVLGAEKLFHGRGGGEQRQLLTAFFGKERIIAALLSRSKSGILAPGEIEGWLECYSVLWHLPDSNDLLSTWLSDANKWMVWDAYVSCCDYYGDDARSVDLETKRDDKLDLVEAAWGRLPVAKIGGVLDQWITAVVSLQGDERERVSGYLASIASRTVYREVVITRKTSMEQLLATLDGSKSSVKEARRLLGVK